MIELEEIDNKPKAKRGNPNWKKGVSGNPGGLTPKRWELTERCKEILPEVIDSWVDIVRTGKPVEKIKAGELIAAYAVGKPTQRSEVSGNDGKPIEQIIKLTLDIDDED